MNPKLIRSDINNIEAYKPGKPIQEVQRELGIKDVIKLASNENPLGPSPKAIHAIRKVLEEVSYYPEGTCFYLKKRLAQKLKISEKNLMFGNGSDELIDVILKTVKEPESEIITADVTFVEYKICGAINGYAVKTIPLNDFKYDLEKIQEAITPQTRVVFIANPNNPTGTYVNASQVTQFLKRLPEHVLVVFDEAYTEYVEENDFPRLLNKINSNNLIILRTFSKIYGLAGLRVGYMIASEDFIKYAERVRQPFNVNLLAQVAAEHALDDDAFVQKSKKLVIQEKKFLYNALEKLAIWFKKSAGNFIFIRFDADTGKIFKELLDRGIIIREMKQYKTNNYARITIGTRSQNLRLIRALKETKEEYQ